MNLDNAYTDVREFHKTFGHPAPDQPTIQPIEVAATRAEWIKDECDELIEARTIEDQADAYLDIIYFAVGGLVELCLKPQRLWNIIHRANMAKRHKVNGQLVVVRRDDGKVVKPAGWVPPEDEMRAEIWNQVDEAKVA